MLLYFNDIWNLIDILAITLFFIGLTLRYQVADLGHARALYALTFSIISIKVLDMFAVSQHLGPFVHIIGKMVS